MLQTRRQLSTLLFVVASLVLSSPGFGVPPAPVVLVERPPLDQAAFEALGFLQRHKSTTVIGDKILQTIPVFVQAVAAEDPYVRFTALWALERIWVNGSPVDFDEQRQLEAVEQCELNPGVWLCRYWDEREQIAARWQAAMAALDVPALTDVLLHTLDDADFWVQLQAIKTLATIREITPQNEGRTQRVLAALLNLTRAPNPFIREAAYRNVGVWSHHAIVKNTPHEAHRDATWLVRRVGALQRDAVRAGLRDADPFIRVHAIRGLMLGALGEGPEAIALAREELLERVRDPHGEVSSEAVFSLGDLNDTAAIGPLLELWDFPHSNTGNQGFIERALRKLSGKSLADLKQEFEWQSGSKMVDYAPVRRKSPARLQRLYQEAETGSWIERISALLELTWVEEPAAYAAINRGLEDHDARVRYATCELLRWQLNSLGIRPHFQSYLDNIHSVLQDTNRHVQKAALDLIGAVGIFGPKQYAFGGKRQSLIEEISEKAIHAEDGFIRQAAVNAFRWLTHERHRAPDVP